MQFGAFVYSRKTSPCLNVMVSYNAIQKYRNLGLKSHHKGK